MVTHPKTLRSVTEYDCNEPENQCLTPLTPKSWEALEHGRTATLCHRTQMVLEALGTARMQLDSVPSSFENGRFSAGSCSHGDVHCVVCSKVPCLSDTRRNCDNRTTHGIASSGQNVRVTSCMCNWRPTPTDKKCHTCKAF